MGMVFHLFFIFLTVSVLVGVWGGQVVQGVYSGCGGREIEAVRYLAMNDLRGNAAKSQHRVESCSYFLKRRPICGYLCPTS